MRSATPRRTSEYVSLGTSDTTLRGVRASITSRPRLSRTSATVALLWQILAARSIVEVLRHLLVGALAAHVGVDEPDPVPGKIAGEILEPAPADVAQGFLERQLFDAGAVEVFDGRAAHRLHRGAVGLKEV